MGISVTMPEDGEAGFAVVEIANESRRNALDLPMFRELGAVWRRLDFAAVRCIVLEGAGAEAFCSGAQLGAGIHLEPDVDDFVDGALLNGRPFSRPIVAAINGHCVAGGAELMLSTDYRVMSADARFGFPEANWGIYPSGGATEKLPREIGMARAKQLLLTGELVDARTALDWGLVNEVLPAGEVKARARAVAARIAANAPIVVSGIKRSLDRVVIDGHAGVRAFEAGTIAKARASADLEEGVRAFLEKRKPRYTGG